MKNIFITGAAGFVGSSLIRHWAEDKQVKIIASDIRDFQKPDHIEFIQADISNTDFTEVFKKFQITHVIHLASIVTPGKDSNRELEYQVDVVGTQNIVKACIETGVEHLTITSSGAAYGYYADNPMPLKESDQLRGNPEFPYSDHKRQVEEILVQARVDHPKLKQLILRPGTILGNRVNNQITNLFEKKIIWRIQGSETPFVFIWDQDVINILIKGVEQSHQGIYNLAGDGVVTLTEIARRMNKPSFALPAKPLAWLLDKAYRLGLSRYQGSQVNFLRYRPVLDNTRLKDEFYQPQYSSIECFEKYLVRPKNVFITGITSGIGLAMAKRYIKKGYRVGGCSFEEASVVGDSIPQEIDYYQADVRDQSAMAQVVESFAKQWGGLDLVFANAGITMTKERFPDYQRGRNLIDINIHGVVNTLEPAIKIMKLQRSGHIVAMSSISGFIGGIPGMSFYGASKAWVYSFFETLKLDLKSSGISVTVMVPGFIRTPLTAANDHKMPFLLELDQACRQIELAIERKQSLHIFPWPMKVISQILRILPRRFYQMLMSRDLIKTGN